VHAYTGAIFVTVNVFAALLVDPFAQGYRRSAGRNALLIAAVVGVLQLPYLTYQLSSVSGTAVWGQ
jgi:hypothetical protein